MSGIKSLFPRYVTEFAYLDNATQNPIPLQAIEQIKSQYHEGIFGSETSIHSFGRKTLECIEESKEKIVSFFGIAGQKISFMPNRDYAINSMLNALFFNCKIGRIIVSVYDDVSILAPVIGLNKKFGCKVKFVDEMKENWENVLAEANPRTLIVVGHMSTGTGLKRNIKKIIELCNLKGYKSIVDFSFSGMFQETVALLNEPTVGILDFSKSLLSPQGVCIAIASENISPFLLGSNNVVGFAENGEVIYGSSLYEMGTAFMPQFFVVPHCLDVVKRYSNQFEAALSRTRDSYLKEIEMTDRFSLIANRFESEDFVDNGSHIITFSITEGSAHDFAIVGNEVSKVCVRSGLSCMYMGAERLRLNDFVQLSFHLYNDRDDYEKFRIAIDAYEQMG